MSALDCTVLGMRLDVGDDNAIVAAQPISAVVIVKAFGEDGDVVYLTEGLHSVECLGMAEYASVRLKAALAQRHDGDEP